MLRVLLALVFLTVGACTHDNTQTWNFPERVAGVTRPASTPTVVQVFADRHGSLYPSGWRTDPGEEQVRSATSLRMAVRGNPVAAERLAAAQLAIVQEISTLVSDKDRVFVLTHGFNDPESSASEAFAVVREQLALNDRDAVIELFWDGGRSPGRPERIWFRAAGTSQIVGVSALRPILNSIHSKDIFLISHSRGASVLLSALSNPSWDPRRVAEEAENVEPSPLFGPDFRANGNRYRAVFLGPAVGCPDFWKPVQDRRPGTTLLRDLPPELLSIHYTVHPQDFVLRKAAGGLLSASYNATNLGAAPEIGNLLRRKRYPFLRGYLVAGGFSGLGHGFTDYARHPGFDRILADIDAERRRRVPTASPIGREAPQASGSLKVRPIALPNKPERVSPRRCDIWF